MMERKGEKSAESISLKLSPDFISDFIQYWEGVKKAVRLKKGSSVSWKKWNEVSQNLLITSTRPFYDKWKHLNRLSWIKYYIKTFSSITLHFKGASILLPKQFILYEAKNPHNTLLASLKDNPTDECLERILISLFEDLNIRLMKSDVQILHKLTRPGFSKSLDQYPKLKELAYGIRRDARTVSSRLDFLIQHEILSLIYLVDMARIGYQTMIVYHNKRRSEISSRIEPYIVMFFPLTTQDNFITILQYPFNDIETYREISKFFGQKTGIILDNQYRGWNFSGLTQNPETRWKLLPPILEEAGDWSKQLLIGDIGMEYNLDPYYDPFPLTPRQGQLLGIIHKLSTMDEDYLAKQLDIGRAYVTTDKNTLLRNRIISRFPIFQNLGLGSWIYFCINGLSNTQGLINILEHLKFFPYVNVFSGQKAGTISGRVNIPHSWTNRFLYCLTALPKTYPECSSYYYIGPDSYAPWAFDILGTFNWENRS